MPLLASRRLAPLLATQTLGALNDNLFKNALVVLILFQAAHSSGPVLVALAGGIFILPYVLLSATAGQVADRFEKSRTILIMKAFEVALMIPAAAGFLLDSTPLLFAVLFGLGIQATFFGPLKYGILPSHLKDDELIAGNGLVEAGTFIGILAGTIAGSALFALPHGPMIVSVFGLAVALAGLATAAFVPKAPLTVPGLRIGLNIPGETWRLLAHARSNRPVWRSILGLTWFWVVGATLLAELPTLVRNDLAAEPQVFTLMLTVFSLGIGIGSLLCASLLRGEVTLRLVPLATLGLSIFLWDFARAVPQAHDLHTATSLLQSPAGLRTLTDLLLLAICGGLYSVPLYAIMQEQSPPTARGSMVAANNVMNAAAMVAGAAITAALATLSVAPVTTLLATAILNLPMAFWFLRWHRSQRAKHASPPAATLEPAQPPRSPSPPRTRSAARPSLARSPRPTPGTRQRPNRGR